MTVWTGHVSRDQTGEMQHGDDRIVLTVAHGDDGTLILQGEAPERHWHGEISKDRQTWHIGCQFGFLMRGTVKFEGGRYLLMQTHHTTPPELRLGDEPGEIMVAA